MSKKWLALGFVIVAFVGGILLLTLAVVPARAQCGEPHVPLCVNCHPEQAQVSAPGEWHSAHYSKAICIDCHGGNGYAAEEALAHEGLFANPLSDIYTDCHQCHPENYQTVASGYAATLNVTPGSCATPTPAPSGVYSGWSGGGHLTLPSTHAATAWMQSIAWIAGSVVLLAAFFFGLHWLDRHHVGR
jgi:hypothetical protein